MFLLEYLNLEKGTITFIGAGGKTSLMFFAAKELKKSKRSVLVTTTTKIYFPNFGEFDYYFNIKYFEPKDFYGRITVVGKYINEEGKIIGLNEEEIFSIAKNFDFILVEGDGAKNLPIKAPLENEPVIPSFSDVVMGVIGIDCFNKRISEKTVFRLERFCQVTNSKKGDIIDEYVISKLINSPFGLFKNSPLSSRKIVGINKVDTKKRREYAKKIFDLTSFEFMVSSAKKGIFEKWR